MEYINLPNIKDLNTIQPTFLQLLKVSWSILWRYLAFGLFFVIFFGLGYHLKINHFIEFFHFIKDFQNSISTVGYAQALTLYSHPIMLLSLIRTIVGFVVTFVVFIYVTQLKYKDLDINIEGPLSRVTPSMKGILYLSWAFYWRILSWMIVGFVISLLFVRPGWWISYIFYLLGGYMALLLSIIIYVLNKMLYKSFGGFKLQIIKKSSIK